MTHARPSSRLACAFGLLIFGFASAANAEGVKIPGTLVTIAAPPGFKVSRKLIGLENAETGSSIAVAELPPEAYAELAALFESPKNLSARFASQGVRITAVKRLAVGDVQVPFATGRQSSDGKEFVKYLAVLKGDRAVLVTFSIADARAVTESDAEAAVRSITLGHLPTIDEKVAQLSFTFKAVPPFHTADVIPGTAAMLTTFDGTDASGAKPFLVIGRGSTSAAPGETPQESERLVRAASGFKDAQVQEQGATTFGGGPGHFIYAVAQDKAILQFLRVLPGGRYIRLLARGETSAMEGARAAVAEIASSVALPE